jgi:putative ABC transport system permease protein
MQGNPTNPEIFYREVVGVVEDTRFRDIRSPSGHVVYVPYTQRSTWDRERTPTMALYLKTSIDPDGLASVVRSELLKIDSHQPVHGIQTLEEIVDGALRRPKMELVILSLFTGLALTLALVGVYGTVSYVVAARTREISVRMALGGTPSAVLGGLLWTYFKVVLTGLGTGLVLAAGLTRVTALELYGVGPMDPWILTAAAVALAAAAFIATLVPACMAARVDPARSLRYE